jgi:hypothetical protein
VNEIKIPEYLEQGNTYESKWIKMSKKLISARPILSNSLEGRLFQNLFFIPDTTAFPNIYIQMEFLLNRFYAIQQG